MTHTNPPLHVAIIMDGNGRWAQSRGEHRLFGHREGANTVRRITTHARKSGLRALTLYAFSEQNWNRPEDEVEGLMELLSEYIISERHEILDNNIRFSTIGDLSKLSAPLREAIAELCHASRENTGMDFCIALSYGGREEILQAVKSCMRSAGEGTLSAADLTEALFESRLYSGHLPPVDLIIRTSGEQRLSNFLLWQAAYAELYFTPTPWPDFSEQDLDEAIRVLVPVTGDLA